MVAGYVIDAGFETGYVALFQDAGGFWPGEFQDYRLYVFDLHGRLMRTLLVPDPAS